MNHDIKTVKVSDIAVDHDWNSRSNYQGIEDLASDIKSKGLLSPLVVTLVEGSKDRYDLIAGFRRMMAIQSLDLETVPVTIIINKNEGELFAVNLTENLSRKDLSTYEIAASISRLKNAMGMSGKQIATRLRSAQAYTVSHINNLSSAIDNLHGDILDKWRDNPGMLPLNKLFKWKNLEEAAQLAELEAYLAPPVASSPGESTPGEGGSNRPRKPGAKKLEKALEVLDKMKTTPQVEGAIMALQYVCGEAEGLYIDGGMIEL